jgi:hypothetical protein
MADPSADRGGSTLVRDYTLIALVALVVVFLILLAVGPGIWSLVPVSIALVAILARSSAGPPLFLLALVILSLMGGWLHGLPYSYRDQGDPLIDVLLAMGVLAYFAAHFRLLTAASHGIPPDYRRRRKPQSPRVMGRWLLPAGPTKRTTWRNVGGEFVQFLVSVPVFAIVAALLWVRLRVEEPPVPGAISPVVWQLFAVLWAGVIVLLIAHVFLSYIGRVKASREQSMLFLQDQLWSATRGEQRRNARWLAWARLRGQRKKEN